MSTSGIENAYRQRLRREIAAGDTSAQISANVSLGNTLDAAKQVEKQQKLQDVAAQKQEDALLLHIEAQKEKQKGTFALTKLNELNAYQREIYLTLLKNGETVPEMQEAFGVSQAVLDKAVENVKRQKAEAAAKKAAAQAAQQKTIEETTAKKTIGADSTGFSSAAIRNEMFDIKNRNATKKEETPAGSLAMNGTNRLKKEIKSNFNVKNTRLMVEEKDAKKEGVKPQLHRISLRPGEEVEAEKNRKEAAEKQEREKRAQTQRQINAYNAVQTKKKEYLDAGNVPANDRFDFMANSDIFDDIIVDVGFGECTYRQNKHFMEERLKNPKEMLTDEQSALLDEMCAMAVDDGMYNELNKIRVENWSRSSNDRIREIIVKKQDAIEAAEDEAAKDLAQDEYDLVCSAIVRKSQKETSAKTTDAMGKIQLVKIETPDEAKAAQADKDLEDYRIKIATPDDEAFKEYCAGGSSLEAATMKHLNNEFAILEEKRAAGGFASYEDYLDAQIECVDHVYEEIEIAAFRIERSDATSFTYDEIEEIGIEWTKLSTKLNAKKAALEKEKEEIAPIEQAYNDGVANIAESYNPTSRQDLAEKKEQNYRNMRFYEQQLKKTTDKETKAALQAELDRTKSLEKYYDDISTDYEHKDEFEERYGGRYKGVDVERASELSGVTLDPNVDVEQAQETLLMKLETIPKDYTGMTNVEIYEALVKETNIKKGLFWTGYYERRFTLTERDYDYFLRDLQSELYDKSNIVFRYSGEDKNDREKLMSYAKGLTSEIEKTKTDIKIGNQLERAKKEYDDNFWGQFAANTTSGFMSVDESLAWAEVMSDPENGEKKKYAESLTYISGLFNTENAEVMSADRGWFLNSISKDFASNIGNTTHQLLNGGGWALVGAAAGFLVGAPTIGAKIGYVAGSGSYGYRLAAGAAYENAIAQGATHEIAKAAATDEGILSALIESGDALLDVITLGTGKAIGTIGKTAKTGAKALTKLTANAAGVGVASAVKEAAEKKLTGSLKKLAKGFLRYGINIAGEGLEEGLQEAVSIATERRIADGGAGDLLSHIGESVNVLTDILSGTDQENAERFWESVRSGLAVALVTGGGDLIAGATITKVANRSIYKDLANIGEASVQSGEHKTILQNGIENLEAGSVGAKAALRLQKKLDKGQDISKNTQEIGAIYCLMINERAEKTVASRLSELGYKGNVEVAASALVKEIVGSEDLSPREKMALKNETVQKALEEANTGANWYVDMLNSVQTLGKVEDEIVDIDKDTGITKDKEFNKRLNNSVASWYLNQITNDKKSRAVIDAAFGDPQKTQTFIYDLRMKIAENGAGFLSDAELSDLNEDTIGAASDVIKNRILKNLDKATEKDIQLDIELSTDQLLSDLNIAQYSSDVTAEFDTDQSVMDSFDITKPNDFVHVQKQVLKVLSEEGFFDEGKSKITVVNENSGMEVEINKKGIQETFNDVNFRRRGRNVKIMKLSLLRKLPELIEKGTLVVDDAQNTHDKKNKYAYIMCDVEINGAVKSVKINIRKSPEKNMFWVHQIYEKNGANASPGKILLDGDTGIQSVNANNSVTQNNKNVKRNIMDGVSYIETEPTSSGKTKRSDDNKTPETLATRSKKEFRQQIISMFNVPEGSKQDAGKVIDRFANRVLQNKRIVEDDLKEFFDHLYDEGIIDVPAEEYLQYGREHLANGRIYVSSDIKKEFGDDWNAFRQRAWGAGVYLVNDSSARGIDAWHQSLTENVPTLFNGNEPDAKTVLEKIVQVAEDGKTKKMSLADYVGMLSQNEYFNENEYLENMERQLESAVVKFAEKATIEADLKQSFAEKRTKDMEDRRKARQNQRDRKELQELRRKIDYHLQWIRKNRRKLEGQLTDELRDVIDDIYAYGMGYGRVNGWSERHQMTFEDVADIYSAAKVSDPNFIPSEELKKICDRIDKVKLKDFTVDDIDKLNDIYKAVIGLRTEYNNRKKILQAESDKLIEDVYHASKQEILSAPSPYAKKDEKGKIVTQNEEKLLSWFNERQLTPMNVIQRMVGWNPDSEFLKVFKQLEEGEWNAWGYILGADAIFDEFTKNNKKWLKRADGRGKDGIWYKVEVPELVGKLEYGQKPQYGKTRTVYMTPMQKIHLYLESKNYDSLRHMAAEDGGRKFVHKKYYQDERTDDAFNWGVTVRLSPETVKHIVSDLTETEMEYASLLEKYYDAYSKERINAVSNVLYGYDRAMEGHYAPIHTDPIYRGGGGSMKKSTAKSGASVHERQDEASMTSLNVSALDAFETHKEEISRFVGYAIPVRNINELRKFGERGLGTIDGIISKHWGDGAKSYIENLVTTIQARKEHRGGLLNSILNVKIANAFGFNWSSMLKQLGSFPAAGAYLGFENMPTPKQLIKVDEDLISKYSVVLAWRKKGNVSSEMQSLRNNPNWTQSNKVMQFTFGGGQLNWMDSVVTSRLWTWSENKVRRENPQLDIGTKEQIESGQSEFYKKVAAEFDNAVSRSQSVSDQMHQSEIRKSDKPQDRALTMFRSDSAQAFNALRQKIGELEYYKRTGAPKEKIEKAKKDVGAVAIGILSNAILTGVINFGRNLLLKKAAGYKDEDDELSLKSFAKTFLPDLLSNIIGNFGVGAEEIYDITGAGIGEIVNHLTQLEINTKWYGIEAPGMTQVNDFANTCLKIVGDCIKLLDGETTIPGVVRDIAVELGDYVGKAPLRNVESYVLGVISWVAPELAIKYGDAMKNPSKEDLNGLDMGEMETRISNIMQNRGVSTDKDVSSALATLYFEGHKNVVPSKVPSTIVISGESRVLNKEQKNSYNDIWSDTVETALAEIVTKEKFSSASQSEKEKLIKSVYTYADERAKSCLFVEYDMGKASKNADIVVDAGLPLSDWIMWKYETDDMSTDGKYHALQKAGFSDDVKLAIVTTLTGTNFKTESGDASQYSKLNTILNAGSTIDDYLGLHIAEAVDGYVKLLEVEDETGIYVTPQKYIDTKRSISRNDSNGSINQKEATAGIKEMQLTTEQKAVLWQIQNKSWRPASNPFSVKIGKKVYEALNS